MVNEHIEQSVRKPYVFELLSIQRNECQSFSRVKLDLHRKSFDDVFLEEVKLRLVRDSEYVEYEIRVIKLPIW